MSSLFRLCRISLRIDALPRISQSSIFSVEPISSTRVCCLHSGRNHVRFRMYLPARYMFTEPDSSSRVKNAANADHQHADAGYRFWFPLLAAFCVGGVCLCCSEDRRTLFSLSTVSAASVSGSPAGSARDRFNFIADVVEKTASAVVYIEIRRTGASGFGGVAMSNGSGFLVSDDGLVVTNAHVVMKAPRSSIQVRLHDGKKVSAVVEAVDAKSDLAILRLACDKKLPYLTLGDSTRLRPGEWVVALGSPLNLTNTVTAGVISSVGRACSELGLRDRDMEYIQTDAAITFGNSGGPLVDLDGQVIGVNSMKVAPGISFAIPIDYAREFLAKAEKWRQEHPSKKLPVVRRRFLGVTMLSLTPTIIQEISARQPDFPADVTHGVLVVKVLVGSPAFDAGVRPGDVVTHINMQPIRAASDIYHALEQDGDSITITVRRLDEKFTFEVQPEPVV